VATRSGAPRASQTALTVAITGPTGDIGRSLIRALERSHRVGRIVGMARRPIDPRDHGWKKTEYRQGDVLDRASVEGLVKGVDVVVHLAFIIFGSHEETRSVNLEGSRNVFEATVEAGVERLVYTSSVAAYGFERGRPETLTEELEPRGTGDFYYSAQKAELEALLRGVLAGSDTDAYVFRPCIVAGGDALVLVEEIVRPLQIGGRIEPFRRLFGLVPGLKPALPDHGVPFQLVHHDDVATALRAAVLGQAKPGVYNLAGDGTLTMRDVASELGWYTIPVPSLAVAGAAELVARTPFLPAEWSWVHALRVPSIMDTTKARRALRWRPKHDAAETLRQTVAGARKAGIIS
jgi:nucleoside-diphosphate-sugar epimerase